ncbi:MAG: carbohydrate kinase family protein [Spirochaetales bacterium]|nr:carbohydrate kinase family protein [Spirochaetales bacterium]
MKQHILCTGTLIVDIINDPVEKALGPNEGVSTSIGVYAGGNAFNVSADLVKLGIPADSVTCLGACGNDFFGDMFGDELEKLGIQAEIYRVSEAATAKIFILKVKGEEPRYYLDEGANALLDADHICRSIEKLCPAVFYSGESGTMALVLKDFKKVVRTAKQAGCLTVVDTVVPPREDWEFLFKAAPFIDIIKCNQYEAQSITGKTDMQAALSGLQELGIPLTVISLAQNGLLLSYNGVRYRVPAFNIQLVDATGAGDAFNAGLIKKLVQWQGSDLAERLNNSGERLLEAVIFAQACGARAVTVRGCLAGVKKSAVLKLLREQEKTIMAGIGSF